MPINKDLKRLVRARMRKTGEAYTAARAHITKTPKAKVEEAMKEKMKSLTGGLPLPPGLKLF